MKKTGQRFAFLQFLHSGLLAEDVGPGASECTVWDSRRLISGSMLWGYIDMMEKKMETTILDYRDCYEDPFP